ncbi:hypothetical protein FBU30_010575 [Linnemannia zychae]|nr:hypothetical protein FBU30_010575 [Linnemannia zychae]
MSYPGAPNGSGGSGSGFPLGVYPQPIGTLSGGARPLALGANINNSITAATAGMSIAGTGTTDSTFAGPSSTIFPHNTIPITTTPAGTAPRKQLAAAAAAGAAIGAAKSGRPKGPYKKAGGGGGGGGASKRGGRGGGRGGRAGSALGNDDDDDKGGKDSDDDNEEEPEVSIEEQFILRLPPGEMCDRFREKVIAREIDESVKLKFSDARRGTFTFEGIDFPTKLVDLPTIIESQKTLNGKQVYKIADISQMLVVDETPIEKPIKTEPGTRDGASEAMPAPALPPLKPSEYIWPDGLTNPLKNVRKRRFRKRVSKVAVEGVEAELERLLQEDSLAEEVVYEIREQVDGMDRFDSDDNATPAPEGGQSDMDMDEHDGEMMDMDEDEEDEDEEDDQYEQDLLAELEREIGGGENATDEEGGTPQPQDRKPASQSAAGHTNHTSLQQNNTHKSSVSGSGNIGGASGFSGLGEIRSASGNYATNARAPATGISSSTATQVDKGKNKAKNNDDDEDEDDEDEDEEEEEDDDDDDSGSDEDDDDDEDDDKEKAQMEKLLKDEIKELTSKIQENQEKLQSAPNEILRKRFNLIVEQLRKELELKKSQLEEARGKSKSK